jgi:hypothetical protein
MSSLAWVVCAAWVALAGVVAAVRGLRGVREGRGALLRARLRSPTIYLFSGYLLVAALVTPVSSGESVSPLFGLALALPAAYALATLSAIGDARPSPLRAAALALLHGGALLAASAAVLAVTSPRFVPPWLR